MPVIVPSRPPPPRSATSSSGSPNVSGFIRGGLSSELGDDPDSAPPVREHPGRDDRDAGRGPPGQAGGGCDAEEDRVAGERGDGDGQSDEFAVPPPASRPP